MVNKLIAIVGPTACGKSDLAVKIARKFNGEVISADSRQVYKGMDIGSGKITKKEMRGVPHHLLDVASPKTQFSVARYKNLAAAAIKKIQSKNKIPILCGGTGLYVQSVVDGIIIPAVKPDWKLRQKLSQKSPRQLFAILKEIDPRRAKTIEKSNPRRLIRAIEIVKITGKAVPKLKKDPLPYPVLLIGVKKSNDRIARLISKRLAKRLKSGMVNEVKRLKKSGLSWKRLEDFGLEYKFISLYLQKKISKTEMIERIQKESEHYAKRQMTWFGRDIRINWISKYQDALSLTGPYLNNI